MPLDSVRHIKMQWIAKHENNLRGIIFYDGDMNELLNSGDLYDEDSDEIFSDYIDLEEGQRIIGLRADTSYDWTDGSGSLRDGYWRNLQFLISNF